MRTKTTIKKTPVSEIPEEISVEDFPFNEMHKGGYFPGVINEKVIAIKDRAEELSPRLLQRA